MPTITDVELRTVLQTRKETDVVPRADEDAVNSHSDLVPLNAVTAVPDGGCKSPLLRRALDTEMS
jgi:hypothetical protein